MLKELLSVDTIKNNAKDFEGWLTPAEADVLFSTASSLSGSGCIVEIGSWCAKSLSYIAAGALNGGFNNKIYSIDPFLTSKDEPNGKYETFVNNLKLNGLYEYINHIKEKSQIAGTKFNESIEFIFIDGFHKYDAVKRDFELFYPKVVNGGYIAIHDIFQYWGPTVLLQEILLNSSDFKLINIVHSTVLAQKTLSLTDEDTAKNKQFMNILQEYISTNPDSMIK